MKYVPVSQKCSSVSINLLNKCLQNQLFLALNQDLLTRPSQLPRAVRKHGWSTRVPKISSCFTLIPSNVMSRVNGRSQLSVFSLEISQSSFPPEKSDPNWWLSMAQHQIVEIYKPATVRSLGPQAETFKKILIVTPALIFNKSSGGENPPGKVLGAIAAMWASSPSYPVLSYLVFTIFHIKNHKKKECILI